MSSTRKRKQVNSDAADAESSRKRSKANAMGKSKYLSIGRVGGVWKYRFDNKWMGEYSTEAEAVAARDEHYLEKDRYPGVSFHKASNRWCAQYTLNGKNENLGSYDSLNEAAAIIKRVESSDDVKTTIKDIQASYKVSSEVSPSQYLSVSHVGGAWRFRFKSKLVGDSYDTEAEAVAARDEYYLGKDRYPGVSFDNATKKWLAWHTLNGKKGNLGSYDSLNEAAAVVKRVESSDDVKTTIKDIQASYKAASEVSPSRYLNVGRVGGAWKYRFDNKWMGEYSTEVEAVAARDEYYLEKDRYPGVSFHKASNRWLAWHTLNGKNEPLGYYDSLNEAAAIIKRVESSTDVKATIKDIQASYKASSEVSASQYLSVGRVGGVWKYRFDNKWMGEYSTEVEAVAARDEYYLEKDRYPGVSFHKASNRWNAQYTLNGKNENLGSYDSLNEAAAIIKRVESSADVKTTIKDIQASYKASSEVSASQYLSVGRVGGVWKYRFDKKWMGEYSTEVEAVAARDEHYLEKDRYPGVSTEKARKKWQAQYSLGGKLEKLGYYDSLNEAAAIIKRVESSTDVKTTIKDIQASYKASSEVTPSQYLSVGRVGGVWKYRFDKKWMGEYSTEAKAVAARDEYYLGKDRYPGVCFEKARKKWQARYSLNGKHEKLGYYDSLNKAAAVVNRVESSDDVKATIKDIRASYKAAAAARKASSSSSSSSRPSSSANNNYAAAAEPTAEERSIARRKKIVKLEKEISVMEEIESNQKYSDSFMANNLHLVHLQKDVAALIKEELKDA